MRMTYDAIVIGSGIGGLTTAGLLARAADKRVLVLERHTEPGGLTHTFRRDGASWDVGVHYIGQLDPGSQIRTYFDYLSDGELEWNRMPEVYDRFVYPGIDLRASSGPERYERTLIKEFPAEAAAIRRYFKDVRRATSWATLEFVQGMVPRPITPVLRFVQRMTGRTATGTTKAYLDAHFRSPELKAVLASQWGDYGLPPSRSAFAVHAMIVSHYLDGGWFPKGGSAHIARTFEKGIEQAGGAVRVAQEVTEILIEDGAAVGGGRPAAEWRGYQRRAGLWEYHQSGMGAGVPEALLQVHRQHEQLSEQCEVQDPSDRAIRCESWNTEQSRLQERLRAPALVPKESPPASGGRRAPRAPQDPCGAAAEFDHGERSQTNSENGQQLTRPIGWCCSPPTAASTARTVASEDQADQDADGDIDPEDAPPSQR